MPTGVRALALLAALLSALALVARIESTSSGAGQGAPLAATQLARTRIVTALQWCPGKNPPPPPPPARGAALALRPCNVSDPQQRWVFASDNAISPAGDSQICLTRDAAEASAPLYTTKCRGSAGCLDPVQQWKYNASDRIITTGQQGRGCLCSSENPLSKGMVHFRYPSCIDSLHPRVTSNEIFAHDVTTGWIWSNCSGPSCPDHDSQLVQRQQYCVTSIGVLRSGQPPPPPPPTRAELAELAAHPANNPAAHPSCIPWSIHPDETRPGWYHDAGMDGMTLTANDTVISIHEAEKYRHQDDNNQIDLVIRRSFDQGASTARQQQLTYCSCIT